MIWWAYILCAMVAFVVVMHKHEPRRADFLFAFGAALLWPVSVAVAVYELIAEWRKR